MYEDNKDFIVTTDTDTSKNLSSATFSFNSPSTNVAAGSYTSRSFDVPLSTDTRIYQIYVEAVGIWTGWRSFPMRDVIIDSGTASQRTIAINIKSSGSGITITFWFVNPTASTRNFAAFDINVLRNDFIDGI